MPSQEVLRFCANHTENPFELAVLVDQLDSFDEVCPRVSLPLDWFLEAMVSKWQRASFAARYGTDVEALDRFARRERRLGVLNSFARNPYLSDAGFRAMVGNLNEENDWRGAGLISIRNHTLREHKARVLRDRKALAAAMRAANGEAGHEGVAVGGADLAEVLGDKSTYVKTHTLEVTASLLSYPEADAEVADRLLRSEATRSSTWMAGDYLAWYYFEGVSEAAPGFWERCTLRPAEVLLLARGAGVTTKLIERFMKQVCSQNAMKRLFDVEFIEALIGSVPAYIGTRPFKTGTRGVARFSAEAIDVLVRSERWSDALWWQDLSDAQFERLLQDEDVHNDLLDALAVTNPRHLEKLFAMWSAQEWDDWYVDGIVYRITELGAEIAHELIATTAGLAYYVLGDGPFGEYIYQLVTEAGLGAGGALEVLEAAKTRALRDVLAEATAV